VLIRLLFVGSKEVCGHLFILILRASHCRASIPFCSTIVISSRANVQGRILERSIRDCKIWGGGFKSGSDGRPRPHLRKLVDSGLKKQAKMRRKGFAPLLELVFYVLIYLLCNPVAIARTSTMFTSTLDFGYVNLRCTFNCSIQEITHVTRWQSGAQVNGFSFTN